MKHQTDDEPDESWKYFPGDLVMLSSGFSGWLLQNSLAIVIGKDTRYTLTWVLLTALGKRSVIEAFITHKLA